MALALLACVHLGVASAGGPAGVGDCKLTSGVWLPGHPGGITAWSGHPCPAFRPGPSAQSTSADGITTFVVTPEGHFPPQNPFTDPPGSNFLMTVDSNLFDANGNEMPNTEPSRLSDDSYLLQDGPVVTRDIDRTSPADDLDALLDEMEEAAQEGKIKKGAVEMALRILEGRKVKMMEDDDKANTGKKVVTRAYSGFPMLHYNGPNKIKVVQPICAAHDPCRPGDPVTGGNVDVNMIYWDQHIESDTAFVDPSAVQEVPWTVTYHVRILHGGIEDFSPMSMNFDQSPAGTRGPFHASMDQTYFPMLEEGKEYTIKIKETLGKYFNLVYTWGWRIHPPRVQVMENALKKGASGEPGTGPKTLPQWEIDVFGPDPMGSEENRLAAIAMIGEAAPAKRMWNLLRLLKDSKNSDDEDEGENGDGGNGIDVAATVAELRAAYIDWSDRTTLPAGFSADPQADITLVYVNNTIYGSRQGMTGEGSGQGPASFKGICNGCVHDWELRPYTYKVTLYNADHFTHGYMNVDFGGSRGWENQFQETDPTTALAEEVHTDPTTIVGERTDIVNGKVVVSPGNVLHDDVLLDNTSNLGKANLRINQATGDVVVTNDRLFPINTGGTEEFLEASPRNPDDRDNGKPLLGSGCFFTFGRNHAWPNAGGPWGPIYVAQVAADGTPGVHKVQIEYNFEPSRRLKVYQFDPLHHDVAVYSLH